MRSAGPGWLALALLLFTGVARTVAAQEKETALPPKQKRVIAVLGDSLAAGHGVEPAEAFPALLQKEIDGRGWNFTIVNAGVSGDTSAGGLRRMDWLLQQRIEVLVLELGGNDGLRGVQPESTRTNLQAIIDRMRAKYPQAQIVIAGMKMPPNMGADFTARFERIYPELAKQNHTALVPFLLEGVGGRSDLNQPDRIHPTPEGHKVLSGNIWKVLGPLLEKMQSGP